jgi:hypothetical protein
MRQVGAFNQVGVTIICAALASARAAEPDIQQLKTIEQSVGFRPTRNFERADAHRTAYYRCYYTGKLELPESYNDLKLRGGTRNGCALDENKYDVFFYAIEAVATGHTPVTKSLVAATAERRAMVVPHEDFHAQIKDLPDRIAEAAATLIGFVTAATALNEAPVDADLFLRKAEMVNRAFDHLSEIYKAARHGGFSKRVAREEQGRILGVLEQECAALSPRPRSFNGCLSAANNAGLAFDHTYTKFYPLVYSVYAACGKDLKCTTQKILAAPRKKPEREVAAYLGGE